jgi:predicted membrane channel-forming protein YqfA (hemolysin III family)
MIEQVTIFFILFELTLKKVNFLVPFRLSLYLCLGCLVIVIGILLEEGSYELLNEKNLIWTLLSGVQLIISLGTFALAISLICKDPHWGAETEMRGNQAQNSQAQGNMSESLIVYRKRLE